MNPKLAALLTVGGAITLSGGLFLFARLDRGTTRAEAIDAGLGDCAPVALECEGRVTCEGYTGPRIINAPVPARACAQADGGPDVLVLAPTRRQRQCFELRGSIQDACELIDGGTPDDDEAPMRTVADRCACRQMDAGLCRYRGLPDGGLVVMGRGNIHPGPAFGPGCVRAPCGEFAGELGSALPGECQ